jgi:regulatory Fis family protein
MDDKPAIRKSAVLIEGCRSAAGKCPTSRLRPGNKDVAATAQGNAARRLGIHRRLLYEKMAQFGMLQGVKASLRFKNFRSQRPDEEGGDCVDSAAFPGGDIGV